MGSDLPTSDFDEQRDQIADGLTPSGELMSAADAGFSADAGADAERTAAAFAFSEWIGDEATDEAEEPSRKERDEDDRSLYERARVLGGVLVAEYEDDFDDVALEVATSVGERAVKETHIPEVVDAQSSRAWGIFARRNEPEEVISEVEEPSEEPGIGEATFADAISRLADVLEAFAASGPAPMSGGASRLIAGQRAPQPFLEAEARYFQTLAAIQRGEIGPEEAYARIAADQVLHDEHTYVINPSNATWLRYNDYVADWEQISELPEPATLEEPGLGWPTAEATDTIPTAGVAASEEPASTDTQSIWDLALADGEAVPADDEVDGPEDAGDHEAETEAAIGEPGEDSELSGWEDLDVDSAQAEETEEINLAEAWGAYSDGDTTVEPAPLPEAEEATHGETGLAYTDTEDEPSLVYADADDTDPSEGTVELYVEDDFEDERDIEWAEELDDVTYYFEEPTDSSSAEDGTVEATEVGADADEADGEDPEAETEALDVDETAVGEIAEDETEAEVAESAEPRSVEPFRSVEDLYHDTLSRYRAAEITRAEAENVLASLTVVVDGVRWSLGAQTGKWYRRGPSGYVLDNPPVA